MTIATRLVSWICGQLVGTDQFGNRYYRLRGRPRAGHDRRWVIYAGEAEATKVPPGWHAWLHHQTDEPPRSAAPEFAWQKEHRPSLTGTEAAYRPPGHTLRGGARRRGQPAYEAWRPH